MKYTDTELINYLQELNNESKYTGRCMLRNSSTGRGWRLHETSKEGACVSVRQAIINHIENSKKE